MSAFFNALCVNTLHGVCLIKKCVSLCKKHKTLRKPVPVFLHSMWFPLVCGFIAGAVCLSYQVQKWNSASRFNVKGNFPYHFAIKLVHGLVTSRFQHPYEIETGKDNIKETAWKNDVFALQYSKLFQSYRQGDRKNYCISVGTDKSQISWHSQKSLSEHRTYSRNGNNRNLPSIIGFVQMCLATIGKKTFFISIGTKLQAIAMDTGLIKAG